MTQFNTEDHVEGTGVEETPVPPAQVAEEQEQAMSAEQDQQAEQDGQPGTDWEAVASERTADLQRLQAEYVNYKKRVDRDRALSRAMGVETVVKDLMPVLDSIALARQHGDVGDGLAMIAAALEKVAEKHGLVTFGEVGDPFDPNLHDALMSVPMDEPVEVTTVSQVMESGYTLNDRVIRPARVGVANPQ